MLSKKVSLHFLGSLA